MAVCAARVCTRAGKRCAHARASGVHTRGQAVCTRAGKPAFSCSPPLLTLAHTVAFLSLRPPYLQIAIIHPLRSLPFAGLILVLLGSLPLLPPISPSSFPSFLQSQLHAARRSAPVGGSARA
eukprot:3738089-Rhodomonas_salina.2